MGGTVIRLRPLQLFAAGATIRNQFRRKNPLVGVICVFLAQRHEILPQGGGQRGDAMMRYCLVVHAMRGSS